VFFVLYKKEAKKMKLMMIAFPVDPFFPTHDQIAYYQGRQLKEQILALEKFGWEVDVFTGWMSPEVPGEELIGTRSRVIRLPAGIGGCVTKGDLFKYMPRFLEEIKAWVDGKKEQYTLIQSNYWLSGWVGRQLKHQWELPHIFTPYALGAGLVNELELNRYSPLARRIMEETCILSTADTVVVSCPEERDVIWRKYGLRSVDVQTVPYGVDVGLFDKKTGTKAERKRGKRVVLYTGGFDAKGGLRWLTDAFRQLLDSKPRMARTIELWVAGHPPAQTLREHMEGHQIQELAHILAYREFVTFLGTPDSVKMAEYYRAADVCIVPAADQGLGVAALETMATSCPVIAPRTTWLRHVVLDGETGVLVPQDDGRMLASALERLLTGPALRKRMGQRASAWVNENFSWRSIGKRWDTIYREVVHQHEKSGMRHAARKQKIG
jgi:D-inositol-3-phosphate glycosyltransferase